MFHSLEFPKLVRIALAVALTARMCAADETSKPIVAVLPDLTHVAKWHDSNGDTADPFWADDDQLYHFICDGRGFGTQPRNLCFNKLTGTDLASLKGELVNAMDDYGKNGASEKDGANWKATGQECIDGTFYAFVARNKYGNRSKDPLLRQTSVNSSLIKSTDRGLTWTRSARENYEAPMWPGPRFGAPGFIHYGRNGGNVKRDGADRWVYALSNNGFWNGGDDLILARVRRADLPKLNAADWQYFMGGDGLADKAWTDDLAKASPVLNHPAKLGWTAPVFVPALNRYLLVSWYVTPTLKAWFSPESVVYEFFEAPCPWGPWTKIGGSFDDRFLGGCHMYGPNLCAKYQERVEGGRASDGFNGLAALAGAGGGVKVELFTSGCPFPDAPGGLYKMWRIPLILRTQPLPAVASEVNDSDSAVKFSKEWQVVAQKNSRDFHGDVHYTRSSGATAEFTFTGAGVEVLAQRYSDSAEIEVSIDGRPHGTVNLALANFPRLVQTPVFRAEGLPVGEHRLKIEVKSKGTVSVDGFRVLNNTD